MSKRAFFRLMLAALAALLLLAVVLSHGKSANPRKLARDAEGDRGSAIVPPVYPDTPPSPGASVPRPPDTGALQDRELLRRLDVPTSPLPPRLMRIFTGMGQHVRCPLQNWSTVPELFAKAVMGAHAAIEEGRIEEGLALLEAARPFAKTQRERLLLSEMIFGANIRSKDRAGAEASLEGLKRSGCATEDRIRGARQVIDRLDEEPGTQRP